MEHCNLVNILNSILPIVSVITPSVLAYLFFFRKERFKNFHIKQVDIVTYLYKELVEITSFIEKALFKQDSEKSTEIRSKILKLKDYFAQNKIFLDKGLQTKITKITDELISLNEDLNFSWNFGNSQYGEDYRNSVMKIVEQTPKLLKNLEDYIREKVF